MNNRNGLNVMICSYLFDEISVPVKIGYFSMVISYNYFLIIDYKIGNISKFPGAASTMMAINSSKLTLGFHPSFSLALAASA